MDSAGRKRRDRGEMLRDEASEFHQKGVRVFAAPSSARRSVGNVAALTHVGLLRDWVFHWSAGLSACCSGGGVDACCNVYAAWRASARPNSGAGDTAGLPTPAGPFFIVTAEQLPGRRPVRIVAESLMPIVTEPARSFRVAKSKMRSFKLASAPDRTVFSVVTRDREG